MQCARPIACTVHTRNFDDDVAAARYMLSRVPTRADTVVGDLGGAGEGVRAVQCGRKDEQLQLFPGSLQALQEIHRGDYPGMRVAIASSADNRRATAIAYAALDLLEVVPGVSVRKVVDAGWPDGFTSHVQIGRSRPLSSDKAATHFPILKRETGIPYNEMVFVDDSNWTDHVREVAARCPVGFALSLFCFACCFVRHPFGSVADCTPCLGPCPYVCVVSFCTACVGVGVGVGVGVAVPECVWSGRGYASHACWAAVRRISCRFDQICKGGQAKVNCSNPTYQCRNRGARVDHCSSGVAQKPVQSVPPPAQKTHRTCLFSTQS